MTKHVCTFLAEGFEEVEAITTIDLLRRAGITVTIFGLTTKQVTGAHSIIVIADTVFDKLPAGCDGIILPGGTLGTANLAQSSAIHDLVKTSHAQGLLCAAICAAPTIFGKAGILRDVNATCYPGLEGELTDARYSTAAVIRDRNIITSRGVGTAIPFALACIQYLTDETTAAAVGNAILYH